MPAFSYFYSIPYILFTLAVLFFALPVYNTTNQACGSLKKNELSCKYYQKFLFLLIFLYFIGFRGYIYTDWLNYKIFFDSCPSIFDLRPFDKQYLLWEKGFLIYTFILKSLCPSYFVFQFVSCLIDVIVLWYFFARYIPSYIILGFLFYILFSGLTIEINLLRNQKSIMLFLLSIPSVSEKRFFKYLLLNVVGSFFHISSVLYIPLYFILGKRYSKHLVLFIFFIGNFVYLFQLKWVVNVLTMLADYIPGRLGQIMKGYLYSPFFSSSYGITVGYLERSFSFIWIYICFVKKKYNSRYLPLINIFLIYNFIYLYLSEMFVLLQRLPVLFSVGYWILFPLSYEKLSRHHKMLFIALLCGYSILKMGLANSENTSAYDNMLFNKYTYEQRVFTLNH